MCVCVCVCVHNIQSLPEGRLHYLALFTECERAGRGEGGGGILTGNIKQKHKNQYYN